MVLKIMQNEQQRLDLPYGSSNTINKKVKTVSANLLIHVFFAHKKADSLGVSLKYFSYRVLLVA